MKAAEKKKRQREAQQKHREKIRKENEERNQVTYSTLPGPSHTSEPKPNFRMSGNLDPFQFAKPLRADDNIEQAL